MYLFKLLIFIAFFYCVQCKNNLKTLTESMGQEIIEIGAPGKDLPEGLEEEPSVDDFSDEDLTSTTVQAATSKRTTTKPPPVQTANQLSQEEDEARIEKEFAEIYKDTDYKTDPTEVSEDITETVTNSTEKDALRQRNRVNFKFQPDMTNKAEIEKFRTSVDEIVCNQRVNKGHKLGMDHIIFGLAISLLCF